MLLEVRVEPSDSVSGGGAATAVLDILILIAASTVAFFAESRLRDWGIIGLGEGSRGVVAVVVGAATALGLVVARGGSWRDIGFKRPRNWWTVPLWVVGILATYVAIQLLAPILVSRFVELPAPDLSRHSPIAGNLRAAIFMALVLPFTASVPEEVIYRGFLMDRLTRIFGAGVGGAVLTVGVQSLFFGSVHFGWGLGGMIVTTMMGAVWGTAFLLCGRNLWIVIIAHSVGHLALVAQLYLSTPA